MLTVAIRPPNTRLLYDNNVNFTISQVNRNAVWLQLTVNESITAQNIEVTFSDYYLFSTPLQTLTYSAYLPQYDLYSHE
jgi:hypothetical protein